MPKPLILCDCLGSQDIDQSALAGVPGVECSKVHTHLCGRESHIAAEAIGQGGCMIACLQERERFEEIAAELQVDPPEFVDIRDRAGWSDDAKRAGPKMAALVADALEPAPPVKSMDIVSEGLCLILGPQDIALSAAERLAPELGVTVVLEADADLPVTRAFDVIAGDLKSTTGAIGNFSLRFDGLRQVEPGGRGGFAFGSPKDGAESTCDVILDLRPARDGALFPAPEKREGYLRADSGSAAAVNDAVFQSSQLVGTFEKPFYLGLDPLLCAHSRAGQAACSKCLDVCPTGAIVSAGDHVEIDPLICAGCGSCAALCPSGAIEFEDPSPAHLFARIHRLVSTYQEAGGDTPRLLIHDQDSGAELISLAARFGRGLPADVIPLDLPRVSGVGHAELLAALACGFGAVDVLLPPRAEREAIDRELSLAEAMAGSDAAIRLLDAVDPDTLCDLLYEDVERPVVPVPILPLGSRRQVARLSARALNPGIVGAMPLPPEAPYGAVQIDKDACTLCLSCASLCPAGALGDNPDKPQLRFQEDACLQCGLCVTVCPENALSLLPQMDLSDDALSQRVLHEEDPFECVECGAPFGVKSTIEKIAAKLEGKHAMFATSQAGRMIRMCDDCRVQAQFHSQNNPFTADDRPQVRTTDDYLSKRRDH